MRFSLQSTHLLCICLWRLKCLDGGLCWSFSISNDLIQMFNFLLRSLAVTLLLLWIHFSSDASICSVVAFLLLRNSDHVVISVSIEFPLTSCYLKLLSIKGNIQDCCSFPCCLSGTLGSLPKCSQIKSFL